MAYHSTSVAYHSTPVAYHSTSVAYHSTSVAYYRPFLAYHSTSVAYHYILYIALFMWHACCLLLHLLPKTAVANYHTLYITQL